MRRSNYFLEHYGVVGMKWGKHRTRGGMVINNRRPDDRRDRNESNYKKSNNDNGNTNSTNNSKNNSNSNSGKQPEHKNLDLKSTQDGLKEGKKIVDAGAKYLDNDRKKQSLKDLKAEARNMSDDDLKTVINRLSMEERYVSAMEKEGVVRAKTDLQKTLEIVGSVAAYADTAISVYDTIQRVRSK